MSPTHVRSFLWGPSVVFDPLNSHNPSNLVQGQFYLNLKDVHCWIESYKSLHHHHHHPRTIFWSNVIHSQTCTSQPGPKRGQHLKMEWSAHTIRPPPRSNIIPNALHHHVRLGGGFKELYSFHFFQ